MNWDAFETKINYTFRNRGLLETAFTHRSYLNENRSIGRDHNERLEFLGDAVLELVVTEYLYIQYPKEAEGILTSYRAALVNTVSLSESAQTLGMNDFLLLSRGESKDTGRARGVILANAFEAVIGALYLDGGYEPARAFIDAQLFHKTEQVVAQKLWQDPKSRFQEIAQEKHGATPVYEVVAQSGPDHDKKFVSAVSINGVRVATGEGKSKQEAEVAAAEKGLLVKNW